MRLAAVGSNCIDYYNNIDGGKAFPGGGPVNMAVYTLRLGGEAAYIGPVGDDVYGQIMIETIKAKGVDTSHLRVEKGKTAVTQVELIDGERVFGDYDEGVLEKYKLTDEDIDYIKNFDVVICDVWGKVEGQFKELKEKGIVANIDTLTRDLEERDRRDMQRAASPLAPAKDAKILDSSNLTIEETVGQVLQWYETLAD